ncbi:MOSC domain-containing protein [Stieleria sp. JC731]|nr:MOSC domain-containing protein [Stieleria sp. JC731]MCC9600605.1 MOSC domain-containing protein [Stieleria sp. JC731]
MMPAIESIQIGSVVSEGDPEAKDVTTRFWTSAFRKRSIDGPVAVGQLGIDGDHVADHKHHGGIDKSILCYAGQHYQAWQAEYPHLQFGGGGFGENLTLAGISESDACIGDHWKVGNCEFQISQPRQPCWKISRRFQDKTMTKAVAQSGRTGWYLRVLAEGELNIGDEIEVIHRPNPSWSIARANDVLFGREVDRLAVIALMNLQELSSEWKDSLA